MSEQTNPEMEVKSNAEQIQSQQEEWDALGEETQQEIFDEHEALGAEDAEEEESAALIKEHLIQHNENKKNPAYLVRGAELMCSQGSNKRMMNLSPCHGVYIKVHPVVHELDCIQGDEENITWFGVCTPGEGLETESIKLLADNGTECHGKMCRPHIIGTWMETYEGTKIVDNGDKLPSEEENAKGCNALTMDSFLVCKYGGIIMPINSGQDREVTPSEFADKSEAEAKEFLDKMKKDYTEEIDREEGCDDLLYARIKEDTERNIQENYYPNDDNDEPEIVYANDWLCLYCEKTVEELGRIVEIPEGAILNKWAMKEGLDKINYYARKAVEGSNEVIIGENGELLDKDGRYWVAVGPNVMNPSHKGTDSCTAGEMKYGTLIDVVITDNSGEEYYVPCVVGDCKAHTYPNGVYQTGDGYPNGTDSHPQNKDYSVIEFCGKASLDNLSNYEIKEIIVYD